MELSEIELVFDRVLILPDKPKEDSGGLYSGEPKPIDTGVVVSIGKGIQALDTGIWIEMQVSVDDRVLYDRFNAFPYMDTGYLITEQGFIRSKIK